MLKKGAQNYKTTLLQHKYLAATTVIKHKHLTQFHVKCNG